MFLIFVTKPHITVFSSSLPVSFVLKCNTTLNTNTRHKIENWETNDEESQVET